VAYEAARAGAAHTGDVTGDLDVSETDHLRAEGYLFGYVDAFLEGYARGFTGRSGGMQRLVRRTMAEAVELAVAARGFRMTAALRRRLHERRDIGTLQRLLQRAATASSLDELLFDD
jgi:hypothetical protein